MSEFDGIEELMQEPPGGVNHGRVATTDPNTEGQFRSLNASDWQTVDFLRAGGWSAVGPGERADLGITAHRGTLHPDEYVDNDVLRAAVEARLGFTYEQVASVYRQGPLSQDQRELRASIDARLLALSRAGGALVHLGRSFGWAITTSGGGDRCAIMERALARARAAGLERA